MLMLMLMLVAMLSSVRLSEGSAHKVAVHGSFRLRGPQD
jgi:hypothetical protein